MIFVAFLLFIPFRKKVGWGAHGIYTAFIIALFTEMFGFPLTIYFISSYFGSSIKVENQFVNYMNSIGMPIELIMTSVGLFLVISRERAIHKSHGTRITTIVYVRHPQHLCFKGIISLYLLVIIHLELVC